MPRRYAQADRKFELKQVFSVKELFETPLSKITVKPKASPGYRITLINWGRDDRGNSRIELRVSTYVSGKFVDVMRVRIAEPTMSTRLQVFKEAIDLLLKIKEKYGSLIPTIGEAKKPMTVDDII